MKISAIRVYQVDLPAFGAGAPQRVAGHMVASDEPGLGIAPNMDALGQAKSEYK